MDYVVAPFTVIVDTREQFGFGFTGYRSDARQGKKPLVIPLETVGLKTGDYSLKGYEDRVAIERKSKSDSYSTFSPTGGRDRFIRELERLNQLEFAGVVIEASEGDLLTNPPPHTKFSPKAFWRSITAWEVRFPKVHFYYGATRQAAERKTLRWLERFYLDDQERLKKLAKEAG